MNLSLLFRAAQITDAQAKDALVEFVSQNCCYGSSPADDMEIKDMKSSSAYHVSRSLLSCNCRRIVKLHINSKHSLT